ncbi:hypothetical protein ASG43_03660 [Aureimonas sp. Leaf454]|nr:hypothetical protein ASG43_03660 [Aureimonas sp. Leaf454]
MTRFLLARRHVDAAVLSLGFALLPLMNAGGKAVFGAFILSGIYLAFARHRVARSMPRLFSAALLAYVVWTVGLSLLRGEGLDGNRALSYAAIEFGFLFLPLGIALVPRPIDAMVAGARLGVLGVSILAPIQYFGFGERVGLGGNEAIFGFLAAGAGLVSRLPAERASRFLPNGKAIFYLSFLPVILSETRAAWLIYGLAMLFDLRALWKAGRPDSRRSYAALAAGVAIAMLAVVPLASVVKQRFSIGLAEYERFQETGMAGGSVDVRLAMWRGAVILIAQHPLTGVGGTTRIQAVSEATPDPARNGALIRTYKHLHNFALDEALTSGLIGLALLFGVVASFLVSVWRWTASREIRECAVFLPILVGSFGSFHGVLLNEWMLIQIFGTMTVLLTALNPARLPLASTTPTAGVHGPA